MVANADAKESATDAKEAIGTTSTGNGDAKEVIAATANENGEAKSPTENDSADKADVEMTTPVKETESSRGKMDVDTLDATPTTEAAADADMDVDGKPVENVTKADDGEEKEKAAEPAKEEEPQATESPQPSTEKESTQTGRVLEKSSESVPEKEVADDEKEKGPTEASAEENKAPEAAKAPVEEVKDPESAGVPIGEKKALEAEPDKEKAVKPQAEKEAVQLEKATESTAPVKDGEKEAKVSNSAEQSTEKDAAPEKKKDNAEPELKKTPEVGTTDATASAAPGNTNMDAFSAPAPSLAATAPSLDTAASAKQTIPTKPTSVVTPPTLPASSSLPVPTPQPPASARRPALVAQPAAKRARVNGTLDAVILPPGGLLAPPDLSEPTLNRYREYASKVGTQLVSTSEDGMPTVPTGNPKEDFLLDHKRYMRELGFPEMKIRTIGGKKLCLHTLYTSVLRRGGVQNVILSRTFRLVGKDLNLPKSCTSAAYILRVDYEKYLYNYEQKHVWNRSVEQCPKLHMSDKVRPPSMEQSQAVQQQHPNAGVASTPAMAKFASKMRANISIAPSHTANMHIHQQNMQRRHSQTPLQAPTPVVSERRPKRQAALAASSAVAAAAGLEDESPTHSPSPTPRRTRTMGFNEYALTPRQEQIVEEELAPNGPHAVFNHQLPGERERVIQALWSADHDDVAFALGTLNALSYSNGHVFQARQFPGLLDALYEIINRHLEDVELKRSFGLPFHTEEIDRVAPRIVPMAAAEIRDAGHYGASAMGAEHRFGDTDGDNTKSSLQQYGNLFNVVDSIAVDREQCATVAINIVRNMSFDDRNAMFLATAPRILDLSAEMLKNAKVPANMRDGLIDMWINISPYLNVTLGNPGHIVLTTCIAMLDPYLEGADYSRFTNCGEILARLAASPERNEDALTKQFGQLLPRLVDMIGGKDRRYVNAGLAALCNCSAFDWQARTKIAQTPRLMPRLVMMLTDTELAPRAALTLLNLAEAPSNRTIVLAYEKQLVQQAIQVSPASDTVAGILYDLNTD